MNHKTIIAFALVAMIAAPAVGHAAWQDELRAQISNLLAQVRTLQAQLQAVEKETPLVQEPQGTSPKLCPILHRHLSQGAFGSDVEILQRYLKSTGDYTHSQATGYYGPLTQQAVQRWQARNEVVAAGTPTTTGYGVVGPATRAELKRVCNQGTSLPTPTICTLQYAPVCGRTPGICIDRLDGGECTDGTIKTYGNSCQLNAAGAQLLYEGECRADTTPTAPAACSVWNDGCNTCTRTDPESPFACTKRLCVWQGIPKCEAYFGDDSDTIPLPGVTFEAVPSYGNWPLVIAFTVPGSYSCADGADYEIDYGDGSARGATPACSAGTHVMKHIYQKPGKYTATLYAIPSGFGLMPVDRTPRAVDTKIITVY